MQSSGRKKGSKFTNNKRHCYRGWSRGIADTGGEIWCEHELLNEDGAVEDGGEAAAQELLRKKSTSSSMASAVVWELHFYV
jgi:hypothetical protein